MAAGDITVLGPYKATDRTAIDTALDAVVGATDDVVSWSCGANQVMFMVIERA